ncbi:GPW/gp25 family protein [Acinetobacter guillouiae]|uniref:GPW/gp25 family protein n=1 Tax=Acinetobacter guillouiae TaxID=106649 RepID=UPI0028D8CE43|nr:GPW/gp25 family protein [Acinetobacter guillouiae]
MMSKVNGTLLDNELDQIKQSIQDILTTPIGSRIMRRNYGSLLYQLTDAPFNEITLLQLYAATASALLQWEDRINLHSIQLSNITNSGKYDLSIEVSLNNKNEKSSLNIHLNFGAIA